MGRRMAVLLTSPGGNCKSIAVLYVIVSDAGGQTQGQAHTSTTDLHPQLHEAASSLHPSAATSRHSMLLPCLPPGPVPLRPFATSIHPTAMVTTAPLKPSRQATEAVHT